MSTSFHKIITGLFWLCSFHGIAQNSLPRESEVFRLIPSQSILLPGDELYYAILSKPGFVTTKSSPIYHLVLQDLNKNEIRRWMIRPDNQTFSSMIELPVSLASGTYIFSAVLYDDSYSKVLVEDDHTIHILGPESNTVHVFDKDNSQELSASYPETKLFTRDHYCEPSALPGLVTLTDSMTLSFDTYTIHQVNLNWNDASKPVNFQKQLAYRILPADVNDLQLFYDLQSPGVTQVKYADDQTGTVKMPDFKGIKSIQWVHVLTNRTEPKITQNYPPLEWNKDELKPHLIKDAVIKQWYDKLQQRALLLNIFDRDTAIVKAKKPKPGIITADNEYDLSRFQPFESFTLFMKEIILPIKVIEKTKGKDLRILMNTTKAWFPQSPLLLVDGMIQANVAMIYDIPVQDVLSVNLYRNSEILLKHFGPMGRNGVIEVITKSRAYGTAAINLAGLVSPVAINGTATSEKLHDFNAGGLQYFSNFGGEKLCIPLNDETGAFLLSHYSWQEDKIAKTRKLIHIENRH